MLELDRLCELDDARKKLVTEVKMIVMKYFHEKGVECSVSVKSSSVLLHLSTVLDDVLIREFEDDFQLRLLQVSTNTMMRLDNTKMDWYKYTFTNTGGIF